MDTREPIKRRREGESLPTLLVIDTTYLLFHKEKDFNLPVHDQQDTPQLLGCCPQRGA